MCADGFRGSVFVPSYGVRHPHSDLWVTSEMMAKACSSGSRERPRVCWWTRYVSRPRLCPKYTPLRSRKSIQRRRTSLKYWCPRIAERRHPVHRMPPSALTVSMRSISRGGGRDMRLPTAPIAARASRSLRGSPMIENGRRCSTSRCAGIAAPSLKTTSTAGSTHSQSPVRNADPRSRSSRKIRIRLTPRQRVSGKGKLSRSRDLVVFIWPVMRQTL